MKEEVKKIMAAIFKINVSEIPDDAIQKGISEWDSLHHLMLIVELESHFDVSFEPEEIGIMISLNKVLEILKLKVNG